jgi:hypothetical protein
MLRMRKADRLKHRSSEFGWAALALFLSVDICLDAVAAGNDAVPIEHRSQAGVSMCIPQSYLTPFDPPRASRPPRDPRDDLLAAIIIPQSEASGAIPDYRAGPDAWPEFRVFIEIDQPQGLQELKLTLTYEKLWNGTGTESGRRVEFDPASKLYKVTSPGSRLGTSLDGSPWWFFKIRPDASTKMPPNRYDFLVAHCSISRHLGSGSRTFNSCSRQFIAGPLSIRYLFDESNVPVIAAMDALLVKKTQEWKALCDATAQ